MSNLTVSLGPRESISLLCANGSPPAQTMISSHPQLTIQNYPGPSHTTPYMFNIPPDNYSNNVSYPSSLNVLATNPSPDGGQRVRSATEFPQYRRRRLPQMPPSHISMSMPDVFAPPPVSSTSIANYYNDQITRDTTVSSPDLQRSYGDVSLLQSFANVGTSANAITSEHLPFNLTDLELTTPNDAASNSDPYPPYDTSSTPSTSTAYYSQYTNGGSYDT
jgi:hypothetical protein